jgi:ABC-type uncharacterized transport system substrate-binding protein
VRRREFIALVGGAVAWPSAADAQQPPMPVIGFLSSGPTGGFEDRIKAFHEGLQETGYVVGQSVAIEYRWAEGQYDRLPGLAAELVSRQVTVIVTYATSAALAAKAATTTIPIVFIMSGDPVKFGLVASLNRPGGNTTGVSALGHDIVAKQFELLHEFVPRTAAVGLLVNPSNPNASADTRRMQQAAHALGQQIYVVSAQNDGDLDAAFTALVRVRAGALVVTTDPYFYNRRAQLIERATRFAIPAVYESRDQAALGGLMSYGSDRLTLYRLGGSYAGRILKGTKPADLPVQQATKLELVINLKTARALGLTFPPALLARADEVIE